MLRSCLVGLTLVLLGSQPQQFPPLTTNPSPHPPEERRMPIDEPEVITPGGRHKHIDKAQLMRDANELAKLADEVPALVAQTNKGLLPKDLNKRLKRIGKLSKQLRQELAE
jgi:hypothetical protein